MEREGIWQLSEFDSLFRRIPNSKSDFRIPLSPALYNLPMANSERTLVVLGCGTSVGVPMIGCECLVCTSADPKNNRTRASVLLQVPGGNILIDTGPELRIQLVREKIPIAHALLYTHYHADHIYGLDDVRLFPMTLKGPLPVYCTAEVERVIRQSFQYIFGREAEELPMGVLPKLEFRRIVAEPFEILGESVTPIPLTHGRFDVFGFRIGNLAYCTDANAIPETSWPLLASLDTLILDCLRPGKEHPSHFALPGALRVIDRVKPRRAFLTHLSHQMDSGDPPPMPDHVRLAFDGQRIEF